VHIYKHTRGERHPVLALPTRRPQKAAQMTHNVCASLATLAPTVVCASRVPSTGTSQYVYIHTYIHTCTHTYIHVCASRVASTRTSQCVYIHTYIHTYTHTYTCVRPVWHQHVRHSMCTYIHTHTHIHMCASRVASTRTSQCVCAYIHTYIHTHVCVPCGINMVVTVCVAVDATCMHCLRCNSC
jgi:hypothetical protein